MKNASDIGRMIPGREDVCDIKEITKDFHFEIISQFIRWIKMNGKFNKWSADHQFFAWRNDQHNFIPSQLKAYRQVVKHAAGHDDCRHHRKFQTHRPVHDQMQSTL